MALPWLLGVAAVGLATWALSGDDDNSSSDREDREREAQRREKESQREQLTKDIEAFKESEIKRIQQKYNTQIYFWNTSVYVSQEDKSLENKINALKDEQDEIKQFIVQLEKERNATNK